MEAHVGTAFRHEHAKHNRRTIAAAGDAASGVACCGHSNTRALADWFRCSARWKSARRALPHAGAR
jgi:hypothetical protein